MHLPREAEPGQGASKEKHIRVIVLDEQNCRYRTRAGTQLPHNVAASTPGGSGNMALYK
jgi:hypothetical protein